MRNSSRRNFLVMACSAVIERAGSVPESELRRSSITASVKDKTVLDAVKNRDSIFEEYFDNEDTFNARWIAISDDISTGWSCRNPANVSLNKRELLLTTTNAMSCKSEFATGYIKSKHFSFLYGYAEAMIKVTESAGINNAFWLWGDDEKHHKRLFEIDIVEARYPNQIWTSLHDRRTEGQNGKTISYKNLTLAPEALIGAHLYGCLWTPEKLVFFFNGEPIFAVENDCAHSPADIRLSTATGSFFGAKDNSVVGTAMRVNHVKVWTLNSNR